jgi:four helix bundle protein
MGQSFKDLIAWQKATDLIVETYKLTSHFPDSERFGLTNQMRRAAVSVASNIAEVMREARAANLKRRSLSPRGSASALDRTLIQPSISATMLGDFSAR